MDAVLPRRTVLLTPVALLVACGRWDGPSSAPGVAAGVTRWDLRTPPDRVDVGMRDGARAAVYESRRPRPVEVLLPGGAVLRMDAEVVAFGSDRPAAEPSTMEISTGVLAFDDAETVFARALAALRLPVGQARAWRRRPGARPSAATSRFGELRISVRARAGAAGTALVTCALWWET